MSNAAMDVINTTFRADMAFLHPALGTFREENILQSCNIQAKAPRSRKHCDHEAYGRILLWDAESAIFRPSRRRLTQSRHARPAVRAKGDGAIRGSVPGSARSRPCDGPCAVTVLRQA
jgi:hypothetical protein